MKAWTFGLAGDMARYWVGTGGTQIIWVDCDDGDSNFRDVRTGKVHQPLNYRSNPESWRQMPLPREWWPQWLKDLDVDSMDEGL